MAQARSALHALARQKYPNRLHDRLSWRPTPYDLARPAGAAAGASEVMPVLAPRKRGRPKVAKCDNATCHRRMTLTLLMAQSF